MKAKNYFTVGLTLLTLTVVYAFSGNSNPPGIKNKTGHRKPPPMNVLFIAVDDMRPELNCYGQHEVISPNIDAIAANGVLFKRAFCQYAVCTATRASLLTGLRPDSTKVYDVQSYSFRQVIPDAVTLPQYFKQHGYHTEWWGKIFHGALLDSISWTTQGKTYEPENNWPKSNWRNYVSKESIAIANQHRGKGPAFESADVADNAYPDGKVAESAVEALSRLKKGGKPFFLAVGFYKPHLPFNAPKKYWDMYDPSKIKLPDHLYPPKNVPPVALMRNSFELKTYVGYPDTGNFSKEQSVQLIHGYRACVSYTDAQIGKVMNELKRLGLADNTIIVLWGDHGWKLADYGEWGKNTNFEIDTHAPLIISVPGMKNKGKKTNAIVEFVDIYPTLADIAGLPVPKLAGLSMSPILNNFNLPGKKAAFSQCVKDNGTVMGYSIRTDRYRFTKWQKFDDPGHIIGMELYDLKLDPNSFTNVAGEPENKAIVDGLMENMRQAGIGNKKVYYGVKTNGKGID